MKKSPPQLHRLLRNALYIVLLIGYGHPSFAASEWFGGSPDDQDPGLTQVTPTKTIFQISAEVEELRKEFSFLHDQYIKLGDQLDATQSEDEKNHFAYRRLRILDQFSKKGALIAALYQETQQNIQAIAPALFEIKTRRELISHLYSQNQVIYKEIAAILNTPSLRSNRDIKKRIDWLGNRVVTLFEEIEERGDTSFPEAVESLDGRLQLTLDSRKVLNSHRAFRELHLISETVDALRDIPLPSNMATSLVILSSLTLHPLVLSSGSPMLIQTFYSLTALAAGYIGFFTGKGTMNWKERTALTVGYAILPVASISILIDSITSYRFVQKYLKPIRLAKLVEAEKNNDALEELRKKIRRGPLPVSHEEAISLSEKMNRTSIEVRELAAENRLSPTVEFSVRAMNLCEDDLAN